MNREEALAIVREARQRGSTPNLCYADLRGADLRGADLCGADLCGADLCGVNLRGVNLRGADLYGANLRGADLTAANLRDADLYGADLTAANLRGADLRGVNLRGVNLRGADLYGANLRGVNLRDVNLRDANLRHADLCDARGVLVVTGLPSGPALLIATPVGWRLDVGCWTNKTPDLLEALIATDEDWPEARGEECAARRPGLHALIALCRAYIDTHPEWVPDLAARWGTEETKGSGEPS